MIKLGQPDKNGIIHGLLNLREERELAVASFGYIKQDIQDIQKRYISLGFHLHEMQSMKYYEDFGFTTFYEFCEKNFCMDKSAVSRCIDVWWEFCAVDERGGSHKMWLDEKYKGYTYSQLCELLPLDEKQRKEITPDMTIKQIREKKKQWKGKKKAEQTSENIEKSEDTCKTVATSQPADVENGKTGIIDAEFREVKEPLSAYSLPKTEYPKDSLLNFAGCGHKYACFSCSQDCEIRQENRYCRTAELGDPFDCGTMNVLKNIRAEIGERCQFINLDAAEHTAGTGEAEPCCKNCKEPCEYECQIASKSRYEENKNGTDGKEQMEVATSQLKEGVPYEAEPIQSELPVLKNNEQRKKWLNDYKAWGLWYRDEHIDVNYYKYDFADGSRLIVEEYPRRERYWTKEMSDEYFFHLLEKKRQKYDHKSTYDVPYMHASDSETYLIEFLKKLQKKK